MIKIIFVFIGEIDPERSTSGIQYGHLETRRLTNSSQNSSKSCVLCQP